MTKRLIVVAGNIGLPGGSSAFQQASSVQGDAVSCPDGRQLTSVFELDGSRFHVLGALASMEGRAAVVSGPTGDVPVVLSDTAPVSTGLGEIYEFYLTSKTHSPRGTSRVTPLLPRRLPT